MRWLASIKKNVKPEHYLQWALLFANHRKELRSRIIQLKMHKNMYSMEMDAWLYRRGVMQGKGLFINRIIKAAERMESKYGKRYY